MVRTQETAARAVVGKALGVARARAPVDRSSVIDVVALHVRHVIIVCFSGYGLTTHAADDRGCHAVCKWAVASRQQHPPRQP